MDVVCSFINESWKFRSIFEFGDLHSLLPFAIIWRWLKHKPSGKVCVTLAKDTSEPIPGFYMGGKTFL